MTRDEAFGRVLREARVSRGLTQRVLAERAALTDNYLSLLEQAKRSISISTLFVLCDALGMKASLLIQGAENLADE
ncbi:helix-turn-helix domain-containing protein [Cupriavidus basilensis]|jgi:transcriptional regulator with XRE-family HTH domain|uniref:helix-turn-helix domain-containing protein n=1 Tax=Cupriavidus basilensis TaxID=68895 RepID=UPI00345A40B9